MRPIAISWNMIVRRHSTGRSSWHKGRRTGLKRSMGQLAHGPAAVTVLLFLACQASGKTLQPQCETDLSNDALEVELRYSSSMHTKEQ